MSQWKITEKTIHKSDFFEIKEQTIVGKNKTRKYQIVERRPTAIVFPLTSSNEIYLLSQYRTLYDKTIFEAVAGHIDSGESPLKAAKRELKEETGIIAGQWEELLRVDESASVIRSTMHIFLARELEEGESSSEESEEIELIKMPLSEAVEKVSKREITNGSTIIGLLYLDKLRKEKKI
jgi:8-oxo-dGTP pyrophosphatase MutT (NUDIX family)